MELTFFNWLVGVAPIGLVLVLMMKFRWKGSRAGLVAWISALILAALVYGADLKVLFFGSLKGMWTTVFVLYIIWGALTLYNIVDQVSGFKTIAGHISAWTGGSKLIQLFVVGWAFPSFIQGVCGFGAPVAVAAPLLVGLGFHPILATTTALIGHSWAVTFGTLGSSYAVMLKLTDLAAEPLAFYSSIFLSLACVLAGLIILYNYRRISGMLLRGSHSVLPELAATEAMDIYPRAKTSGIIKEGLPAVIILGATMVLGTMFTANFVSPYIASLVAGMLALVVGSFGLAKAPWYKNGSTGHAPAAPKESFHVAFSPYYILIAIVFSIYLSPLKGILDAFQIGFPFPETGTAFGHINAATKMYSPIKVFTAPGTLIFASAFVAVMVFKGLGLWKSGMLKSVGKKVVHDAMPASLTVVFMSMLSVVMVETGMMSLIARGIASFTGQAYPIFAPLVGGLGAFMTGSNTSSNILFSVFQKNVADLININALVILGLQTTGGALGNMFSPMNIALGTSVTNTLGQEGKILSYTLLPGLLACVVVGLLGLVLSL